MKKILTYYELINEELLIKNKKLVKSYAKEIENEVSKAINSTDMKFIYSTEVFDDSDTVLNICNLKEGEIKYVEKIAKKWQNRLIENNISIIPIIKSCDIDEEDKNTEIKLNNNNNHKQVIKYLKVKLLDSTQIEYNKKG